MAGSACICLPSCQLLIEAALEFYHAVVLICVHGLANVCTIQLEPGARMLDRVTVRFLIVFQI